MSKAIFLFLTFQGFIFTTYYQTAQNTIANDTVIKLKQANVFNKQLPIDTLIKNNTIDSIAKSEQVNSCYTFKSFRKDFGVSIGLIGLGLFASTNNDLLSSKHFQEERNEDFPYFQNHADDFFQYAPVFMIFGIHLFDDHSGNTWGMQGKLLLKSFILMNVMVLPLKSITHVKRPDGSNYKSFPSGHTANAFMGAEFLRKEYGREYPLIAISGYAIATGVGVFRFLNNKHWISDVLVGAGLGMASVNIAYLSTDKSKLHNDALSISPAYFENGMGFSMTYKLNQKHKKDIRF